MSKSNKSKIREIMIKTRENGYAVTDLGSVLKKWAFESMDSLQTWMKENLEIFPKKED